MTINGQRDHFSTTDLVAVGESISLAKPAQTIDSVCEAVARWPEFARAAGVHPARIQEIGRYHRLNLA